MLLCCTEETRGRNTSCFLNVTTALCQTAVGWDGRGRPGVVLSGLRGQTHTLTTSTWCENTSTQSNLHKKKPMMLTMTIVF